MQHYFNQYNLPLLLGAKPIRRPNNKNNIKGDNAQPTSKCYVVKKNNRCIRFCMVFWLVELLKMVGWKKYKYLLISTVIFTSVFLWPGSYDSWIKIYYTNSAYHHEFVPDGLSVIRGNLGFFLHAKCGVKHK